MQAGVVLNWGKEWGLTNPGNQTLFEQYHLSSRKSGIFVLGDILKKFPKHSEF